MSSEHVWGRWHRSYTKEERNKFGIDHIIFSKDGSKSSVKRTRAGTPLNSQVRVVCRKCNNTWLSEIQDNAKQYLVPLVQSLPAVLGINAQIAIATWATMACMTGEHIIHNPAQVAVPQSDRSLFMATRTPLPDWRIWIGSFYPRRWAGSWVHACMPIIEEGACHPQYEGEIPMPNTHWTTFIIGKLYVHISSSTTSPDYIRDWNWINAPRAKNLLLQIWPINEGIIVWPIRSMTDHDAEAFAMAQFNLLRNISQQPRTSPFIIT